MRDLRTLDKFRVSDEILPPDWREHDKSTDGFFAFKSGTGIGLSVELRVIVSIGEDWEHVSVSVGHRCPTWDEMCTIKDIFWNDWEAVIQVHPAKADYVNCHPYCLHMWRPMDGVMRLPPKELVGG